MSNLSQIDDLNRGFGIAGIAQVIAGNGGLPKLSVTTKWAAAEIYLHGAQVTSWHPSGCEEILFLSDHSHWQDGKAIRGGIPICFPWFRAKADNPKAPSHGFVRTKEWQLGGVTALEDGAVLVALSTGFDASTLSLWPHDFRLVYRIRVGAMLQLELTVENIGSSSLSFEEALHTYFKVSDAQTVRVHGLDQTKFLDNTDGNREKIQSGDVSFNQPTDNAYLDTEGACDLIDAAFERSIRTEKQNSATTVVWNPWQEGAAALADLGDDEWRQMACVEASNILSSAITLKPGQKHTMRATILVAPLVSA